MFFLIASVHPKQTVLDQTPRRCPGCGLFQARLVRRDYYLSLFFLPLFRVKKGETLLSCGRCGRLSALDGTDGFEFPRPDQYNNVCPACGKTLERPFRFCPYCGRIL